MNKSLAADFPEGLMLKRLAADAFEILSLALFLCSVAMLAHP